VPEIGLATTTVRRSRGQLPQLPLVNMFLEQAVTEPRQFSLLSTPGLAEEGDEYGAGPIRALFQYDGVVGGKRVAVSGADFYVDGTSLGTLFGDLVPSIAGNEIGVAATAGGDGAFFDGVDYSAIAFPDGAKIRKLIEQGGRFIAIRDGTGAWYFTEVLTDALVAGVLTFEALNFATAESETDALVDALAYEDALILGGTRTIEFWSKTGDSELPYTPSTGRVFQKGVRATGCMALFDNSFVFVSPDNIVYRAGNVPERISDAGIEELIAASATCRVDSYFFEGHELLKVHLDETCIEYDAQTQQWSERRTASGNFLGGPVVDGPLFGSTADGKLYEYSGYADLGSYHERSFCLFVPVNGGAFNIDSLAIRANPGHTDYLSGDYADPTIELYPSSDGGQTFDAPFQEFLGEAGEYRREVEWRALGAADYPGFYAKIRVTDPVSFRCSGAFINEPHGGRAR
jgi:hypothetical protein